MCRRSELLFFYQDGASHLFPDKFEPYREHIPVEERGDMIAAYYRRLTSPDAEVRRAAAKQWCLWEMGTSKLIPDSAYIDKVRPHHTSHHGYLIPYTLTLPHLHNSMSKWC